MSIEIEDKAYCKILLHMIKHTLSSCFGILIGKKKSENDYLVSDAIPLSHESLLAPQVEFSLLMIEKILKSDEVIVGVYENLNLNYHEDNPTCTNFATYLLENIHNKKTKFPLMFMISTENCLENENSLRPKDTINFRKFYFNGQSLDFVGNYTESKSQFEKMKGFLSRNRQNEICDFDDHFNNVNSDWRNSFIN